MISVCIPARNEEKAISRTLEAMISQNPDEIIVCDNGSSDRTSRMVEKKAVNHSCVKLIHSIPCATALFAAKAIKTSRAGRTPCKRPNNDSSPTFSG